MDFITALAYPLIPVVDAARGFVFPASSIEKMERDKGAGRSPYGDTLFGNLRGTALAAGTTLGVGYFMIAGHEYIRSQFTQGNFNEIYLLPVAVALLDTINLIRNSSLARKAERKRFDSEAREDLETIMLQTVHDLRHKDIDWNDE